MILKIRGQLARQNLESLVVSDHGSVEQMIVAVRWGKHLCFLIFHMLHYKLNRISIRDQLAKQLEV